jgi:phage protein D
MSDDDDSDLVDEETQAELDAEQDEVDADNEDDSSDSSDDSSSSSDSSDSSDDSSSGITPEKMAKNALRKANKEENTGSINLVGDPRLVGAVNITLENFGSFDTKYIISKATHRLSSSSGYTTDIEIRKCLSGY